MWCNIQAAAKMLILLAIPLEVAFANAAWAAPTCVDSQWQDNSASYTRTLVMQNMCSNAVEVVLRSPSNGRVCYDMRIDPHVTREVRQAQTCSGINGLTQGCSCESRFLTSERPLN
jgi:hypothetical protein